jgi:tyrosinase
VRNPAYPLDVVDQLEEVTMPKVEAWMAKRAGNTNNCTLENAAVRREWYAGLSGINCFGH